MTRDQFNSIAVDFYSVISNIQVHDGYETGYSRTELLDAFMSFYDKAQNIFDAEEEACYIDSNSKDYKFGFNYAANLMKNKGMV